MTDHKYSQDVLRQRSEEGNPYVVKHSSVAGLPSQEAVVSMGMPTQDEKTLGMVVHLLAIVTGFVGVVILWILKKDDSKFIDYHARESLNFMISISIYGLALSAATIVIGFLTFGIGAVLLMPLVFVLVIGSLVLEIMACMAANRGEYHRYPFTLRLIPTAR